VPKYYTCAEFLKLVDDEGVDPKGYKEYMDFIRKYRDYFDFENNTLEVPSGMMMGTMNHMSSTVFDVAWSAVTARFKKKYEIDVYAALSSDDYVSWMVFSGKRWEGINPTKEQLGNFWLEAEAVIRQFAINASLKKNMYCLFPNFEYTSQIHTVDGFIPFIGSDIGSLFAPGLSVAVDLQVCNKVCETIQQKGCGTITAAVAMQISVNFVRALHRLDAHYENPRSKLGKKVIKKLKEWAESGIHLKKEDLMICHGGRNPWISTNIGIPEAALKDNSKWPDFYIYNVFTQDNPFLNSAEDQVETTDRGRRNIVYHTYAKTCDATTPVLKQNLMNDKRFKEYLSRQRDMTLIGMLCAEFALYIKRTSSETLWSLLNRSLEDLKVLRDKNAIEWVGDVKMSSSSDSE